MTHEVHKKEIMCVMSTKLKHPYPLACTFNPLVPKLFHDFPSKYASLKKVHGHEWVKQIK